MAVFELDIELFTYASCYYIEKDKKTAMSSDAIRFAFSSDVEVSNPRILEIDESSNARAIEQFGRFLILPDGYDNLEVFESECIKLDSHCEFLTKHVIPSSNRISSIHNLHLMKITSSRLFGDRSMASIDAAFNILSRLS